MTPFRNHFEDLLYPHPLGKKTPYRFLRHRSSSCRKVDMQGQKESGFNVSSAYVLKGDMESSFPVDAISAPKKDPISIYKVFRFESKQCR